MPARDAGQAAGACPAGSHPVVHRAAVGRQVHHRPRPGPPAGGAGTPGAGPGRRRGAPAPVGRARLHPRRPGYQRQPDRLGGPPARLARRDRAGAGDRALRRRSQGRPCGPRGRGRALRRGLRLHPAGRGGAPGREGAVRQGPQRRDQRHDRGRRPVRRAAERGAGARHHGGRPRHLRRAGRCAPVGDLGGPVTTPTQTNAPRATASGLAPDALRPLTELQALESESIHIFREVAATFRSPVMLFSGGKDSVVMLRLAAKAFWPAPIPFSLLHVDTGHNFPEVLEYRDQATEFYGASLKVARVQDYIDDGRLRERPDGQRNPLQTVPLLDAITEGKHDAVFGGGRRDEERARAKERVFSMRDQFGQWDPRNQRPELWSLYNGRHLPGEHVRVFPLSNWTELDVWDYIDAEKISLPSIYYAHEREVALRDGMWIAITPVTPALESDAIERRSVRYRTVGDMSCTAAVLSEATTVADVITEVGLSQLTERGATRADDRLSEAAMEDRKREGYF